MQIKAVDFFMYGVADMDKALAFYCGILGLSVEENYEGQWIEFAVGGTTLALIGPPHGTPSRPGIQGGGVVALAVEDVQASLAELQAKGVQVVSGPHDTPVCNMVMIADPDGNRIWLHQRKDGTCG
ncbi:MAG: VOC family protein [Candidatus Latescibacteria bacterium]|nr:VOC family protein [Candidatus Latescibacterota bacterium]